MCAVRDGSNRSSNKWSNKWMVRSLRGNPLAEVSESSGDGSRVGPCFLTEREEGSHGVLLPIRTLLNATRCGGVMRGTYDGIPSSRGGGTRTLNRWFWRPVLCQIELHPCPRRPLSCGSGSTRRGPPEFPFSTPILSRRFPAAFRSVSQNAVGRPLSGEDV